MARPTKPAARVASNLASANVALSASQVQNALEASLAEETSPTGHWEALARYLGRGKGHSQDIAAVGIATAGFSCGRLRYALVRLAGVESFLSGQGSYVRPANLLEHGEHLLESVLMEAQTNEQSKNFLEQMKANSAKNQAGSFARRTPEDDAASGQAYAALAESTELAHGHLVQDYVDDVAGALDLPGTVVNAGIDMLRAKCKGQPPVLVGARMLEQVDDKTCASIVRWFAAAMTDQGLGLHVPLPTGRRYWVSLSYTTLCFLPVMVPLFGLFSATISAPEIIDRILTDNDMADNMRKVAYGRGIDCSMEQLAAGIVNTLVKQDNAVEKN